MITKIKKIFNKKKLKTQRQKQDNYWIFGTMLVGGLAGLLASFELSVQALVLAKNPDAVLSCSVNDAINCASVALHPIASFVGGIPNSFFGMMAMPVVITIAVAALMGTVFPRLFMFIAQLGYAVGLIVAFALLYASLFIIHVVCPWCFLLYIAMIVIFFAMLRYNIRENNLFLPKKHQESALKYINGNYDRLTMAIIIVTIIGLIFYLHGAALFG